MTEHQFIDYLKVTFGPGVVFAGWLIGRGLTKLLTTLTPIIIDAISEMKMLRASMEDLKKLGPRLDKVEVDVDEGFKRIRKLESNGAAQ